MRKSDVAAMLGAFAIVGVMDYVQAQPESRNPVPAAQESTQPGPVQMELTKPTQAIQRTSRFAVSAGLARASKVIGMKVKDLAGKDAGNIEDLLLDARGEIAYGVLSFGGFLGIGDKLFAVPWRSLVIDRENNIVSLDVSKETLERAPSFAQDKWPVTYDRSWSTDVRKAGSDASITAAVKSKLVADKVSSLVKVNVDTDQGVVELSGTVDSERTKQRASELALQVEGVRKVVNNLKTG
jgi:hypothetical protein